MTSSSNGQRTPKILGADVELGNFILGDSAPLGTGAEASRRLLVEVPGADRLGWSGATTGNPQDVDRRYLRSNGGCVYIDLDHLEVALPETTSAFDHVAHWRAMLLLAREAATRANQHLPHGQRIELVANNSDGLGNSFGSHVNLLVTRDAWDNVISRKAHFLAYLSAFQVSGIVFTGQGKVGSENGRPEVAYQLSQRADFIESVLHYETTRDRPIVNCRDEPHCEPSALARLHLIFFDSTLCDTASLLRVGTLQIVGAMIEAGCVNPALALDDPLTALQTWSRDPSLRSRARMVSGGRPTAVDLQFRFLKEATRFVESGGCDGIVPRAGDILALWHDTLIQLRNRDFVALSRRLDWVLKLQILKRAMAQRPGLTWASTEIKFLDQLYANLDQASGLFWTYERAGLVDRLVSDGQVQRAMCEPPADTRAWTRAHLLRHASPASVEHVDWDRMTFKVVTGGAGHRWLGRRTVHLSKPFAATRQENEQLFAAGLSFDDIVMCLQSEERHAVAWRFR